MKRLKNAFCPCGNPQDYADCCARYHAGIALPNAEALMRSRYSAYVFALESYLLDTWHNSTRPPRLDLEDDEKVQWLGLEIKRYQLLSPDRALVEFVARHKTAGRARRMHEVSRFVCENGRWYYVDGEFPAKSS